MTQEGSAVQGNAVYFDIKQTGYSTINSEHDHADFSRASVASGRMVAKQSDAERKHVDLPSRPVAGVR